MIAESINNKKLPKLTKAEIIDNISYLLSEKSLVLNKREIHSVLESFFDQIKNGLIAERIVELRGFGTFELRLRKGREKARNPRTGEILPVESHHVAVFRPGKELKKNVWGL